MLLPWLIDETAPGLISVISDSLGPGVTGVTGGILASITFQTLAAGNAQVALLSVLLQNSLSPGDPEIDPIPLNLIPCDATECIQNGVVEVIAPPTPVPEPSTLGLMGIGLAALARRLRRKTPAAS